MDSPDNNEDFAGRLLHQGKFYVNKLKSQKLIVYAIFSIISV